MTKKIKNLYNIRMDNYDVKLFWDDEANAWVAVCDEIPLTLHAETIELLIEDVKETTLEILELNKVPPSEKVLNFQINEILTVAI